MIKIKKRAITLIEMMIVMFLIAMITGVVAYNYRGSLDQGKIFKTEIAMEKLSTILNIAIAKNPKLEATIEQKWKDEIEKSPLVKNKNDLIYDAWGEEFNVRIEEGQIQVTSERYNALQRQN